MFPRASSFAPGATESSRSMNTSSAGRPGALASILGEEPGTERQDLRGRTTRSVMRSSFPVRSGRPDASAQPDGPPKTAGVGGTHSPQVDPSRRSSFEHLTDLDLAFGAILAGVDAGKRLERKALGPSYGLVHRGHLEDPVARDQLF